MTSDISLADKVIVITGASRGIGEAIAYACASAGAKVVVSSRKQPGLDAVASRIREAGGQALPVACHMGKREMVDALFEKTLAEFGRIDGFVNNAATNPYFGRMVDCPEAAFDKTLEVNLKGYFYGIRGFVAHASKRDGGGSAVNIASVAGMNAAPMQGVYGMSKAAVISMTKTMAFELGGSNIRVNAIAPGLIETRFASAIVQNKVLRDQVVGRTALNRHGQPVEIAGAAVYLLSDASSFMTGQTVVIDGGYTL